MKKAKRYPFLKLQRQRFALHFDNQSSAAGLPSERDFYRPHCYFLHIRMVCIICSAISSGARPVVSTVTSAPA